MPRKRKRDLIIKGFSKLLKEDKLKIVSELMDKQVESVQADILIEIFFTKRTGDFPDMMKLRKIRVLVVPSRSTYFLDKKGQSRGIDYELLKGWEKMLNKGRKKGTPPISVIFIPVTLEELGDALLEGRGDIAGVTLVTPDRANEFAYATPIFDDIKEVVVTAQGGPSFTTFDGLADLLSGILGNFSYDGDSNALLFDFSLNGFEIGQIFRGHKPETNIELFPVGRPQGCAGCSDQTLCGAGVGRAPVCVGK